MNRPFFDDTQPDGGRLTDPGRQVKDLLLALLSQDVSTVHEAVRRDSDPRCPAFVNGISVHPPRHPANEIDGRVYGVACVNDHRVPFYLEDSGGLHIGTKGEIRNCFYAAMEEVLGIQDRSSQTRSMRDREDLLHDAYQKLAAPPPVEYIDRSSCLACTGPRQGQDPQHLDSQVGFVRCTTCGLVARVGADDRVWAHAYGDMSGNYFQGLYFEDTAHPGESASAHGYEDYEEWVRVILGQEHFDMRARRIAFMAPARARRALDVGCATGELAGALHRVGYQTTGVDASPWAIALARSKFPQLEFRCERVEELAAEEFDLITLMDVFEHLSDPYGSLRKLRLLLPVGGLLMLELPNQGSLDASILGSDYLFAEHLYFYTPRSICAMLVHAGFTIVARQSEHDHYFRVDTFFNPPQAARLNDELRGERLLVFARRAW